MNQYNGNSLTSWSSTAMAVGTIQTGAIRVRDFSMLSLYFKCTGTPTGTLKVQCSIDTGDTPTNWEDVASQTLALAGAAGSKMFDMPCYWSFVRFVYTGASGSGTITVTNFQGKGYN